MNWSAYEKQHYQNLLLYSNRVKRIYNNAIDEIFQAIGTNHNPNIPFNLDSFPIYRRKVEEITGELQKRLKTTTVNGITEEWNLSNAKNNKFIQSYLSGKELPASIKDRFFNQNIPALDAFTESQKKGIDMSTRIWKSQFRGEIEAGLQLGIGDGTPSTQMATNMKRYLQDPDKLFRRVRDKYGNLTLSKAAKEYHPGQGKYRSSYKNSLRLTRDQMNMAYRNADYTRWNQMDFILGFEVHLSGSHHIYDICDEAVGRYPKTFKFIGWHAQCLCFAVPITASDGDFDNYISSILSGKEYTSTGQVPNIPTGLIDLVSVNRDRIASWRSAPYFIKDNFNAKDLSLKIVSTKRINHR